MTATSTAPALTPSPLPRPLVFANPAHEVVGRDERIPLLDGRLVRYVNLDNAASTPAFRGVVDTVQRFLPYASSVHRGSGYKSRISTAAFEDARARVGRFVGADPERDVVLFAKNTTEAINKLARSLTMDDDAVVLTTLLEHHSNELPWRARPRARTVCIRAHADGTLDEEDLDRRLREHAGRVALLAVSGASNVTGVLPPVHRLAEKVHAVGGRILVDAAQLAPHRAIDMRAHEDPGHLDFVAMSAHKLYAPFGSGALVGHATRSRRARTTPAAARSTSSRSTMWSGPSFPIARKPARRTCSAPSRSRPRHRSSRRSASRASPPTKPT